MNDGHRYGYNGQEKVDEVAGSGNHTTAEFWEYDTRLGRRWNLDPRPVVGVSDYATLGNNPILYNDPNGDSVDVSDLYKKDKQGRYVNYTGVETFELWASTKVGKEYLLSHAEKGFSFKGEIVKDLTILAKNDGADHRAGVDVAFGWTNSDYGVAETTHRYDEDESGNLRLKLGFLFHESDVFFRLRWNADENRLNRNATPQEKVLIGIDNWNHEIFLHGYLHHRNFLDGASNGSGNLAHHPLFKLTPYYSISTDMLEYFARRMGIQNSRQDIFDSIQMPGMQYSRGRYSPSKRQRSSP